MWNFWDIFNLCCWNRRKNHKLKTQRRDEITEAIRQFHRDMPDLSTIPGEGNLISYCFQTKKYTRVKSYPNGIISKCEECDQNANVISE